MSDRDRSSIFQELYEDYANDVYRFALWLGANRRDAEDITSETFARALASNTPIRTATARGYLFTIARHYYHQMRRRTSAEMPLLDSLRDLQPPPDVVAEQRSEAALAQSAFSQLSDEERSALVMRTVHDMPYAEIARALGISIVAAKVRVHRARKKLSATKKGIDE